MEIVRSTITEVFRILKDEKLKDPAKRTPRRQLLEQVIASHFDYTEMSKRALAANWVPLTPRERSEFVELFKSFLSDRYAERIEAYSGEQVAYLSERIEGNYADVRTKLQSSKVEIPMDYRLHLKDGTWHAFDIIVDGVSLVKNYRSQFDKIIRSTSYQELIRQLRERTLGEDKKNEGIEDDSTAEPRSLNLPSSRGCTVPSTPRGFSRIAPSTFSSLAPQACRAILLIPSAIRKILYLHTALSYLAICRH